MNNPEYFKPSSYQAFDFSADACFDDYITHTRDELRKHRIFIEPEHSDLELERVAPFHIPAKAGTPREKRRGFIFVHGYIETAFSLRDIVRALAESNYITYGLLLPGHGTRPGDLLTIKRKTWYESLAFAVRCMRKETSDITLVGFSLGGLLSVISATRLTDINRLVLLAPALQLSRPWLAAQATWVRLFRKWWPILKPYYPVRYQSCTVASIAEIYLASRHAQKALTHSGLKIPVLMVLSDDDAVIDTAFTFRMLQRTMTNPKSDALVYKIEADLNDSHYTLIDHDSTTNATRSVDITHVLDPEARIISLSHVSLPYAPDNPVLGIAHTYQTELSMGSSSGGVKTISSFGKNPVENWYGEFSTSTKCKLRDLAGPRKVRLHRIKYNPHFNSMIARIKAFLHDT